MPVREWVVGDIEATLWILLGAVGFLLLIALALPPRDTLDSRLSFHRQVVDRLRALPGAVDVAAASTLPLDGVLNSGSHSIEGRPLAEGDVSPMFAARVVSPGYFAAMRIALGAQAGDVRRPLLAEAGRLALVGVTLGVGAALALTRQLQAILFETSPVAPVVFGGVSLFLVSVCLLASWMPARRAGRVEPVMALRVE